MKYEMQCSMSATDLMERGFEWTLAHGLPLNTARFNTTPQPKCCSLAMVDPLHFILRLHEQTPWSVDWLA